MGTVLKILLAIALVLLCALASLVTVAVALLKEDEGQPDASPDRDYLPHDGVPRTTPSNR